MNLLIALLGAAPAAAPQESPSMWPTVIMFVALGAIMYFFMIRPQQKKQKQEREFRDSLKVRATVDAIPEKLTIDVAHLGLGKSIKCGELSFEGLELVTPKEVVVVTVKMTRAAMGAAAAAAAK